MSEKPSVSRIQDTELIPRGLPRGGFININPLRLDFTISGTVEKPQFEGFTRSLAKPVKPNLKNIGQMIKSEAADKGIAGVFEAISGKKEGKD